MNNSEISVNNSIYILDSVHHANKGFVNLLEKSHLKDSFTERDIMSEINSIEIEETYDGPHVQLPITLETTKNLIDLFRTRKVGVSKSFFEFSVCCDCCCQCLLECG